MKKLAFLSLLTLTAIGCNNSGAQPTANSNVANAAVNRTTAVQNTNDSEFLSGHSSVAETPGAMPYSGNNAGQSSSGASPMSHAVDVGKMTGDIEAADKNYKQNPKDEKAKDKLAEAYFVRAFALTDAAQYRSALGDFRKGLKLNPNNVEAKAMHDQIIDIFVNSLHRDPPKEGDEPPPMPIK